MPTNLDRIKAALAGITADELRALGEATNQAPQLAPGLLAWLEAACIWEWHRRTGKDYELEPLEAAIPDEEDAVSVEAAMALRDTFGDAPAVRVLFDELVKLLTGSAERKH